MASGSPSFAESSSVSKGAVHPPDKVPGLILGAAWYPEQWPESDWEEDLRLMEAAHLHMIRIGEFAWSRMEPEEGKYQLDWLERAIALAAKHHIITVLGTPTDAPPAWLTSKYPDVLRVEINGHRDEHGNRRQFSYTSPRYREFCRQIVERMAIRFGHNPNVVGWQIGNEFSFDSYDPDTKQQFQQWLKAKYGTLEALNQRWTTSYWSQTYTYWDQIPLEDTRGNPGLLIDHKRFVSDVWKSFAHDQIAILRQHINPKQFITTNIGGLAWSDSWDHYVVTQEMDLASWDDYVGQGHLDPYKDGAMHDLIRGLKRKNFWVMETAPGYVNWAPISNILDRDEVRMMAWEAIAHGSDAVSYWQWRSALNGQEQYHGVIVGPDGTPVPVYKEIEEIGAEFEKASPALAGTSPKSDVALLHSYDSRWAIDFQLHNRRYDQQQILLDYYRPLKDLVQSIDIVNPYVSLDSYKLVVAPDLNMIPDDLGKHLLDYAVHGGHLVLGPRSGMKDAYNALDIRRQPGPLVAPLGGRVEQYYALDQEVPLSGSWGEGRASLWAEQLSKKAADTQVLLRYGKSNGWLDEQPAVITRKVGRGRITYIGAVMDPKLMKAAAKWMIADSEVKPVLEPVLGPAPDGVEVCRRIGNGHQIFFLLNHNKDAVTVPLPHAMKSILTGKETTNVHLPLQGVEILEDGAF